MTTVQVFNDSHLQAIYLPQEFRFDVDEVEILRRGDEIVLRKKPTDLKAAFELLAGMPEDFFADGRVDPPPETREAF